jgi:hypothetical protein
MGKEQNRLSKMVGDTDSPHKMTKESVAPAQQIINGKQRWIGNSMLDRRERGSEKAFKIEPLGDSGKEKRALRSI